MTLKVKLLISVSLRTRRVQLHLNWRLLNPLEPRSFVFSFNLFCTYYRRHAHEIKYISLRLYYKHS